MARPNKKKRALVKSVTEKTGLHQATVYRALQGQGSEDVQEKVSKAIDELKAERFASGITEKPPIIMPTLAELNAIEDRPIIEKGPSRKETVSEEKAKARHEEIVTLFAIGFHSIYGLIAQFEGKHWDITEEEGDELATTLKKGLDTLEGEEYERAIRLLSRVSPWAHFGAAAWTITRPRLEQSRSERAAKQAAESPGERGTPPLRVFEGYQYTGPFAEESYAPSPLASDGADG
jgi:hypothetical protein